MKKAMLLSIIVVVLSLYVFPKAANSKRILLIDRMTHWDGLNYMSLCELAVKYNVRIDLATGSKAKYEISNDKYSAIIIFGGGGGGNHKGYAGISSNLLSKLYSFVKAGGNLAFFTLPRMKDFNEDLHNLFSLYVGKEYITSNARKTRTMVKPGEIFWNKWKGLMIGSKESYPEYLAIMTYFAALNADQKYTETTNKSGDKRKLSIEGTVGKGKYLFISNFATGGGGIGYRNEGNILHDKNIDFRDNKKAGEILLEWLTE
ncbi:hypothetical protein KAU32_12590 [bacterium]|nr:hypothetical protein [bacterium]